MSTGLYDKIIDKAKKDNLPEDHELVKSANEFKNISNGFFSTPQTKTTRQFVNAWAKARRLWCEYSNESLI